MERPDLPVVGPEREFRLVATTTNLAEANTVAEQYEMQGYQTKITRKMKAGISIFQVWIARPPFVLQGGASGKPAGAPSRGRTAGPRGKLPKVRSK